MSPIISAAVIGGVCGIIGAIIGISPRLIKQFSENLGGAQISKERRLSLKGTWKGESTEMDDKGNLFNTYPIVMHIKPNGRKLQAIAELTADKIIIKATGRIFTDKYFHFYYSNVISRIIHYGSSIAELSDDAQEIRGKAVFCGFGSKDIIFATYIARKDGNLIELK